jgi:soluble lytic murein transglycosylase-like protein
MRVFLLKERFLMLLTLPILVALVLTCMFIGMYIGIKVRGAMTRTAYHPASLEHNSPAYRARSRRSSSGCVPFALLIALLIAGWFVLHTGSFSLPLPTSFTTLQQSIQAPFTTLKTSSYQSLPLPQTTHQNYVDLAQKDANAVGLVPAVFIRQINQESGFDPNASGAAGEIGIAQFMPDTARSLGINAHDPAASLSGAAHLMASYLKTFNGDYEKALAAYNAGAGTVQQAVAKGGANWKQDIPASTQHYVAVILNEG